MMTLATALAALTITVWPQGTDEPSRTWTLRCNPPGGTLPGRVEACRRLSRLQYPFRPVPQDAVCTQIYGGPQEALVRGTFRGKRVWTRFKRRDGCEIARWKRVGSLFPSSGAQRLRS